MLCGPDDENISRLTGKSDRSQSVLGANKDNRRPVVVGSVKFTAEQLSYCIIKCVLGEKRRLFNDVVYSLPEKKKTDYSVYK